MRSNKVEYGTDDGVYCTTHDVKVPFCMPDFSSSNLINHRFHDNNYRGKSGIGYYIIVDRDLMVQLGLEENFKCQVLQWDGATALMKYPAVW